MKINTFIPFIYILLNSIITLSAQQLPIFTQYRQHYGIINPAAINSDYFLYEYNLSISTSYRKQWTSLEGAPTTQSIQLEYIQETKGAVGLILGGHLINDQTGPIGTTGVYGRLGGILSNDPAYGGLSFGLTAGVLQHRIGLQDERAKDSGDFLTNINETKFIPDVGAGIFYYQRIGNYDNFYVGASIPQIFGLALNISNEFGEYQIQRLQHFYGVLGFYKFLNEEAFLEPSIWVKYVSNAPVGLDFNLRYQLSKEFWLGIGISTSKNLHLETGVVIGENLGWDKNLKIGYGFDSGFNQFGARFGNTHEFNLTIMLDTYNRY